MSKTWYDTLTIYFLNIMLLESSCTYKFGITKAQNDLILVQAYYDCMICGSTNENLCKIFAKLLQSRYRMSMLEELQFFLEQASQENDGDKSKYMIF